MIIEDGTVDHARYVEEVLPVAQGYDIKIGYFNKMVLEPHIHHLTEQCCRGNFPSFIDKDYWPPNRPDLNPFDFTVFVKMIDWNRVTSKATMIEELKHPVKNLRQNVVFESFTVLVHE